MHQGIHHIIDDITSSSSITHMDQTDNNVVVLPSIELTNTTGTYLHHLNEDCLMAIFSCKSLNLIDLSSIAETCSRFNRIVQRVVPKNIWFIITNSDDESKLENYGGDFGKDYEDRNFGDTERILRNFGSRLSALLITCQNEDTVDLVAKYCGANTLNRLVANGMESIEYLKEKLNSIFERLLKLSIRNCHLEVKFFTRKNNCHSLTELEIVKSSGCVTILKQTYPNLKRFTFRHSTMYSRNDNDNSNILLKFIERHKRLRSLSTRDETVCSSELIHTIGNCMELEELTIRCFDIPEIPVNVSILTKLTKLRTLDIYIDSGEYSQYITLLQAFKSLESVSIKSWSEIPVPVVDAVSQLPNLRVLELICGFFHLIQWELLTRLRELILCEANGNWSTADLCNIIRQLTHLELLELCDEPMHIVANRFTLSEAEFYEIVRLVRGRKSVLSLICNYNFLGNCNENRNVKLIKSRRLH